MRRGVLLGATLLLAACGGSTPTSSHSPPPTSSAATSASAPPSSASPSASPIATGPATLVHCTVAVPPGDNLVIGTVAGDPTVVVRDIQDPANAHNLCSFDSNALTPQFASAGAVVYETSANQIIEADLASGTTTILASFTSGFGSGQYSMSPDGRSVTYMDGNAWHVAGSSGNRVLATLPVVPARGTSPNQDDSLLSYSPDGQYIALFQTFHTGGSGETAADQIRRASDGSLVYSTSGMTMAVWASVPSRLFFRDTTGNVHRWDASAGLTSITSLSWVRPKASPDGRWIAYTFPTVSGVGGIGFYGVQSNSVSDTSPPGRSGVRFLTNDLVWYVGERACSSCFGGAPTLTGVAYIYDIAGQVEVVSRLSSVDDAWPHTTPAAGP
jgi:hypothetical protein